MNLKNIARDSFWVKSLVTSVAWSTTSGNVGTDGTVYSDIASAFSSGTSGAGGSFGMGVLMDGTINDNVPYRVKAYVPTDDNVYLLIGYAPASPTGDDTPAEYRLIHLIGEMDDIFIMPAQYGGSYEDRAIIFAVYSASVAIGQCAISVQKLDVAPPQFSIAVP
jgi:hypothetical protein